MSNQIRIEEDPRGGYLITATAHDGEATFSLVLTGAEELSDGRLDESESTATAATAFLFQHQDAGDLPVLVELGDIVAAYPDAVDAIVDLRGRS